MIKRSRASQMGREKIILALFETSDKEVVPSHNRNKIEFLSICETWLHLFTLESTILTANINYKAFCEHMKKEIVERIKELIHQNNS